MKSNQHKICKNWYSISLFTRTNFVPFQNEWKCLLLWYFFHVSYYFYHENNKETIMDSRRSLSLWKQGREWQRKVI